MTISIIVNGAQGKMGQEAVKAIQQDKTLTLVGQTDKTQHLADVIKKTQAQIVVDFTVPSVVYENCLTIIHAGAHPVIGTSGLTSKQIIDLKQMCEEKKLGGIIAPNFALGAILMMHFAQIAARFFPAAEIVEAHHAGKLDAPSGTALKTAEMIAEGRAKLSNLQAEQSAARGLNSHGVSIHSLRLPGVVASQEVIFGGPGETLTLRDNTIHREAFMPGLLLACKKVVELKHLVYGLENILDL